MEKKSRVLKATQIVLNITFGVFVLVFAGGVLTPLLNPDFVQADRFLSVALTLVGGFFVFNILMSLKQIVGSVSEKNPFSRENIHRFRRIGYFIFGVGALYAAVSYPGRQSGVDLIATPYGSLGPEIFIFITGGCIALLMGEIFSEALKIKEENDMTI